MNLSKLLLLTLVNFLLLGQLLASQIIFEKSTFNFGEIKEDEGPISFDFNFYNQGEKPFIISNVSTECGCTTPFWPKDTVYPGTSNYIRVQFETFNRPGPFKKKLKVYSNAYPQEIELTIKGFIIQMSESPEYQYPFNYGSLRLKSQYISFGRVLDTTKNVKVDISLFNESDQNIYVNKILNDELIHIISLDTLKAKAYSTFTINIDASQNSKLGFIQKEIKIYTTDPSQPIKKLYIVGNIDHYVAKSNYNETPKLEFVSKYYDLGKVPKNRIFKQSYQFKNLGNKPLKIIDISSTCACIIARASNEEVQPGDSASIQISYSTAQREGYQLKNIAVYSNDPERPLQLLKLKSVIKKD